MYGSAFSHSKFTINLFMFLIFIDPFVLLYYQHLGTQLLSGLHYVQISLL